MKSVVFYAKIALLFLAILSFLDAGDLVSETIFGVRTDYLSGKNPQAVVLVDLDGDNHPDIVSANSGAATISVLKNNGDGTFTAKTDYPSGSSPSSIIFGDFDSDNDIDLAAIKSGSNTFSLLLNSGNGTFQSAIPYPAGETPVAIFVVDIDDDYDMDLVTANSNSRKVTVFFNLTGHGYVCGDANGSGNVNVSDAVMIINYVFVGGRISCDTNADSAPDC